MIDSAKSDPALHLRMREAYVKAGRGNFVQAQHILESTGQGSDTSPGPAAAAEDVRPAASAPQDLHEAAAELSNRPSKHSAFEPGTERMAAFSGAEALMGGEEGEDVSGFGSALSSSAQTRIPVGSGGVPVPPTGKSPEQKQQEAEEMRLALEKQEEAVRLGGADPLRKSVHMKPAAPLDPPPVRGGGRRTRRERKKKRKRRRRARTRKR